MAAPFELVSVRRRFFTLYFSVQVRPIKELCDRHGFIDEDKISAEDWRTDSRRFIEAAIREKLEREAGAQ